MPLSVRYLHLRGHPQTLRAGSENIAHSNDAVGLLRVPVKVFVRYRTPAQTDFLHPGCVTVADTDHRKALKFGNELPVYKFAHQHRLSPESDIGSGGAPTLKAWDSKRNMRHWNRLN
jgi:hypothetical protein